MEKIKLQKYFSDCGIMSRRMAEAEISAGKVSVNGSVAMLGDRVDPESDSVLYNGTPVFRQSGVSRTYIALNKPTGYVTTMSDEKGRKTVADLISDVKARVYPVGRLDMYSDGLLLLTDDGELTNKLTHPSHNVPKKYRATVTSHLTDEDILSLSEPFGIDGYMLRPFGVELEGYIKCGEADSTVLIFTLFEGRNREIRKICEHHGLKIARLTRFAIGKIKLSDLKPGKWRTLTPDEIEYLKKI